MPGNSATCCSTRRTRPSVDTGLLWYGATALLEGAAVSAARRPWVVIYDATIRSDGIAPYTLECRRCGERYTPTTPISVVRFVEMGEAFGREHRACRPHPIPDSEIPY